MNMSGPRAVELVGRALLGGMAPLKLNMRHLSTPKAPESRHRSTISALLFIRGRRSYELLVLLAHAPLLSGDHIDNRQME